MDKSFKHTRVSLALTLLITAVTATLGVCALVMGYAPGSSTRFGVTPPLFDGDARQMGVILLLISLLPLISFMKTARQATYFGTVLGILITGSVFWFAYA